MDRNDGAAGTHRQSESTGRNQGQTKPASSRCGLRFFGFSPIGLALVALHHRRAHRLIFSHP